MNSSIRRGLALSGSARVVLCSFLVVALAGAAAAPTQAEGFSYQERLKLYQKIEPMGDTPFGEQIGLYTGSLSFNHLDVSLEGSGPTIIVGRQADTKVEYWPSLGTLGDWDLTIPRIETLVRSPYPTGGGIPGENWKTEDPNTHVATLQRCTKFNIPYDSDWMHDLWWNGYEFINESGQRQPLLKRSASYASVPQMTIGGEPVVFTGITSDNWQIGCLPSTSNSQAGEGFLVVSPAGMRYHLTHLVGIPAGNVEEQVCDTAMMSTTSSSDPQRPSHPLAFEAEPRRQNAGGPGYVAPVPYGPTSQQTTMISGSGCTTIKYGRMFVAMYVSKIEDRFGNFVTYGYEGDKLTSITGSDGRSVTINWRTDWRAISSIVVPGAPNRTWVYAYDTNYRLSTVTLPDGSTWEFNNLPHTVPTSSEYQGLCTFRQQDPAVFGSTSSVGTIKTPSNLLGTFTVRPTFFGRSYVPSLCVPDGSWTSGYHEQIPPLFTSGALYSKSISGPGVPISTWTYSYAPATGSTTEDSCAASSNCAETRWVDVTEPGGSRTRHTFSTRWGATEGKLLQTDTYQGPTLLRSTEMEYLAASQGAYPSYLGGSFAHWTTNSGPTERWAPMLTREITQQGQAFTWQVATGCTYGYCFDLFARPTKVIKSSGVTP